MTNKELAEKYPFLEFDEDYKYSHLDGMPEGWKKAFGEQMCEEIREVLVKNDFLDRYFILEVKEKWGGLRWYDSAPWQVRDEIDEIIDKYETLSEKTCVVCGEQAEWISKGWIAPYCTKCKEEAEATRCIGQFEKIDF